jgi:hypothetical protein
LAQKVKKELDIVKIVNDAIDKAIKSAWQSGIQRGKTEAKDAFRKTESRLYAYPELLKNVDKYKRDIEDLQRESPGRSKDLVFYSIHGGSRLTDEEIMEGRILLVQKKMERDQAEIDEINYAMEVVKGDEYYPIIDKKYFQGMKDDEIAADLACDPSTVRRNKSRLIRMVAVKLYGAEAVP